MRQITDQSQLADWLQVPPGILAEWLSMRPSARYHQFRIGKRRGGSRLIQAPIPRLKEAQAKLARHFETLRPPSDIAFGYMRHRSIFDHASKHRAKRWIAVIDVKDFFGSIPKSSIECVLKSEPISLNSRIASIVADLCCVDDCLPQGAPSSPVLSNYVCSALDRDLLKLAIRTQCDVSRYADDICFSSDQTQIDLSIVTRVGNQRAVAGDALSLVMRAHGFSINERKTRITGSSGCKMVTGLVVNRSIAMPKRWRRQLRTLIYLVRTHGVARAQAMITDWEWASFRNGPPRSIEAVIQGKVEFLRWLSSKNASIIQSDLD